jgi:hypothetical protein
MLRLFCPQRGFIPEPVNRKKPFIHPEFLGEPSGTRTRDPVIKSCGYSILPVSVHITR